MSRFTLRFMTSEEAEKAIREQLAVEYNNSSGMEPLIWLSAKEIERSESETFWESPPIRKSVGMVPDRAQLLKSRKSE